MKRIPLLALLLAIPAAAQAAMPGSQPQMQNDMRDLTPLPRTPHDTYTGDQDSPDVSVPAPVATPTSKSKRRKKNDPKDLSTVAPLPPSGIALNTSTQNKRSAAQKALDSIDLFYGFFLNGPSLGSNNVNTTYSPWQQGTWPTYIYHTLDMQYHFDRSNLVGFEISNHQDIASGVTPSGFTTPVEPQMYFNDPQFWYTRRGVLSNRYFSMDLQFNAWPGITSPSQQSGEYLSASLDTTWNMNLRDRRWTAYFTTRVRPYFYTQPQPDPTPENSYLKNEWLYVSAGYYVGYSLSDSWQVNLSGVFDNDMYADVNQFWNHGDGSDDRAQLELNYFAGRFARIGAYFQSVVTAPSLVSSIVGLDITINLMSAK